jgi:hypothetical protein
MMIKAHQNGKQAKPSRKKLNANSLSESHNKGERISESESGHRRAGISKVDDSLLVCAVLLRVTKTEDER